MKRFVGASLLGFYVLLGVSLLTPQAKRNEAPLPRPILVTSRFAILDLLDDFGPVRLIAQDPESEVLVRVKGANPSRLFELIEANCRVILVDRDAPSSNTARELIYLAPYRSSTLEPGSGEDIDSPLAHEPLLDRLPGDPFEFPPRYNVPLSIPSRKVGAGGFP